MKLSEIDFQELRFYEIGSWPLPLRIVVMIIAGSAVIGLVYYFLINNALTELEAKRALQVSKRNEYRDKYDLAVNLPAYEAQMVDIQKMYTLVLRQLPSDSHIPELLENVNRLAERNGIKITSIKLGEPQTISAAYRELPIDFVLIGNYHSFGRFISDVAKLSRIVTLDDFNIKYAATKASRGDSSTGQLTMSIKAKTYWLANTEEKAVAEGSNKGKEPATPNKKSPKKPAPAGAKQVPASTPPGPK